MGRGPHSHLDAALSLLDEHGPANPGLGMSVAIMTAATGVSRSSIYRQWTGVQDLNHDLAVHAVLDADGWQRRLLRQPVDAPLEVSIEAAVVPTDEVGIWARATMRSWPDDAPVRATVAEWERHWLAHLERWLDAHLGAHGRRWSEVDATTAALALTALIEGTLLLDQVWSLPDDGAWFTGRVGHLPTAVARLVDDLTEPALGGGHRAFIDLRPGRSGEALPDSGLTGTKRALLERATDITHDAPFGAPESLVPTRLFDPARLARRLDVSERRVFDIWPTTAEANADVVVALAGRAQDTFTTVAGAALEQGLDRPPDVPYDAVTIASFATFVRSAVTPGAAHLLQCTTAFRDPAVRLAFNDSVAAVAAPSRQIWMAALWMAGNHLRPEVDFDEYLGTMRATVTGVMRLLGTHGDLAHLQACSGGRSHPLPGVLCDVVRRSLVDEVPVAAPSRRSVEELAAGG